MTTFGSAMAQEMVLPAILRLLGQGEATRANTYKGPSWWWWGCGGGVSYIYIYIYTEGGRERDREGERERERERLHIGYI